MIQIQQNVAKMLKNSLPTPTHPHPPPSRVCHEIRPLMLFWSHQNHPVDQVTPSDDYFEVGGNLGGVWWRYCRHTGPNGALRPILSGNRTFWTPRDAIWTTPSPKLLLLCMLLPKSNMRTERASFKCRLGPQLVFLVLIPVHIKKLDVLHYILSISKWI